MAEVDQRCPERSHEVAGQSYEGSTERDGEDAEGHAEEFPLHLIRQF
jgi:hypothetical protein